MGIIPIYLSIKLTFSPLLRARLSVVAPSQRAEEGERMKEVRLSEALRALPKGRGGAA